MTEARAAEILTEAYRAEVEDRGRVFVRDRETADNIGRLASFLTRDGYRFGVMLCGVPGNGKTTLLRAFQSAVNWLRCKGNPGEGMPGIRIVGAREAAVKAKDGKEFGDLCSAPMIAIEDMGREPAEVLVYGNVLNPVADMLECRYDRQLFTFITTNLRAEEVRERYGDRIADRFNEMMEVIVFGNGSYRNRVQTP